jgi:hypothetical protein
MFTWVRKTACKFVSLAGLCGQRKILTQGTHLLACFQSCWYWIHLQYQTHPLPGAQIIHLRSVCVIKLLRERVPKPLPCNRSPFIIVTKHFAQFLELRRRWRLGVEYKAWVFAKELLQVGADVPRYKKCG